LYISIYLRSTKNSDPELKKILIIPQLTRIGDIVCSTPVFRSIKIKYPKSHIAVLVSKKAAGIIRNNTRIDEVILYEDYSFWQLIRKIRKEAFGWSFSLSATSVSTLIVLWGLVRTRVKTTRLNRPITELITDWMNNYKLLYKDHTYLPRHHLNLLSCIDIKDPDEVKEIFTSPINERKTDKFLNKHNISNTDTLVGISITAGNKIKEWGDKNFFKLAQKIVEKYNAKVIFIGSPSDKKRIKVLLGADSNTSFIEATDFSVEELPSLFKKLNLFIAVDTGPIYIAHALGVPLINIIGPVDPSEQPPNDKKSMQILPREGIPPSSFVFKKRGSPKDIKNAIDSIGVDKVFSVVDKLLSI